MFGMAVGTDIGVSNVRADDLLLDVFIRFLHPSCDVAPDLVVGVAGEGGVDKTGQNKL